MQFRLSDLFILTLLTHISIPAFSQQRDKRFIRDYLQNWMPLSVPRKERSSPRCAQKNFKSVAKSNSKEAITIGANIQTPWLRDADLVTSVSTPCNFYVVKQVKTEKINKKGCFSVLNASSWTIPCCVKAGAKRSSYSLDARWYC